VTSHNTRQINWLLRCAKQTW